MVKPINEKKLKLFSKKQHKKHVFNSLLEGAFALTPFVALVFGVFRLSRGSTTELMAPGRWSGLHFGLILVTISYFIFLVFIMKDVKGKLFQK